jgi:hypothetical protein
MAKSPDHYFITAARKAIDSKNSWNQSKVLMPAPHDAARRSTAGYDAYGVVRHGADAQIAGNYKH